MKISILTLFPEMFESLNASIIGRAIKSGIIDIDVVDIRDFSLDKHHKCDDIPFGGGAGMVMTPQPVYDAINSIDPDHLSVRIYMSPKGEVLTSDIAQNLAAENRDIILLCGHYEGVDQRVLDMCIDREISIGDYVLTGGELPAMIVTDCICRFIPGVLHSGDSAYDESFMNGLLEYPHYTRPQVFMGVAVPEVLLSGHHANIDKWRHEQSIAITRERRKDLLEDK